MNKKCVKICTPRALPSGDIIALAIDKSFSALFTLKYKFRTNSAVALFGLALTFLISALWDRRFCPFSCVNFFR